MSLYDLIGKKKFNKAYQNFLTRWRYKHPTPYDLFFTFEDVLGQSLGWLIKPWFLEFAYVDLKLIKINNTNDNLSQIKVLNKGGLPVPIHLKIKHLNNGESHIKRTAAVWKQNNDHVLLSIPNIKQVKSIELLNPTLIDMDTTGQILKF
jgi:aminopeptidase N